VKKNIKYSKNTLFLGMKFSELIRQNTMWKGTKVLLLPQKLGLYINQFIRDFFSCKFLLKKKKQGDHQSVLGFQTQFSFIIYFLKIIEGSREEGEEGGDGEGNYILCMYMHTYIQP
jgi:hypothetical protein